MKGRKNIYIQKKLHSEKRGENIIGNDSGY